MLHKSLKAFALALAISTGFTSINVSAAEPDTTTSAWELLKLTNKSRMSNGLNPLSTNDTLATLAYKRAQELAQSPNTTGLRPDGSSAETILDNYNFSYTSAIENDIAGTRYSTAASALSGWTGVTANQTNILSQKYVHLGTGYLKQSVEYQNYWTQMFVNDNCSLTIEGVGIDMNEGAGCYKTGTSIDNMSMYLKVSCANHGTSYLPVTSEMCSGYDSNRATTQTITISCFSDSITQTISLHPFTDLGSNWYTSPAVTVYNRGYMTGLNSTTFGPVSTLSRAQFAVILYRMAGSPSVTGSNKFPDVASSIWYTDAVTWASSNGIITGYVHNGRFGPADRITREQIATMLYRYACFMGYDTSASASFSKFTDASRVTDYAQAAMKWCVGCGIITGKNNQTALDPQGSASRAECATMIERFINYYNL